MELFSSSTTTTASIQLSRVASPQNTSSAPAVVAVLRLVVEPTMLSPTTSSPSMNLSTIGNKVLPPSPTPTKNFKEHEDAYWSCPFRESY
jgi:hypothetical protein